MNARNDASLSRGNEHRRDSPGSSNWSLFSELRPVIVEPWDIKDEEDGLPEKSLVRNAVYVK
jgi:NOPS (NUC059) domain